MSDSTCSAIAAMPGRPPRSALAAATSTISLSDFFFFAGTAAPFLPPPPLLPDEMAASGTPPPLPSEIAASESEAKGAAGPRAAPRRRSSLRPAPLDARVVNEVAIAPELRPGSASAKASGELVRLLSENEPVAAAPS